MYDTQEEAIQKLSSCVVLFNDAPTLIQTAKGSGTKLKIYHNLLRTGEDRADYIMDKGFDFRSLGTRLGYTNYESASYKEALYLTRAHVRKSHSTQGLSQHNVRVPTLRGSEILGLPKQNITWSHIYNRPYTLDTLERKYPTVKEVESRMAKDQIVTSLAFNKQFAVRRTKVGPFYLEYRGKDIGYTDDFFRWKIGQDFSYLDETFEMLQLKVA